MRKLSLSLVALALLSVAPVADAQQIASIRQANILAMQQKGPAQQAARAKAWARYHAWEKSVGKGSKAQNAPRTTAPMKAKQTVAPRQQAWLKNVSLKQKTAMAPRQTAWLKSVSLKKQPAMGAHQQTWLKNVSLKKQSSVGAHQKAWLKTVSLKKQPVVGAHQKAWLKTVSLKKQPSVGAHQKAWLKSGSPMQPVTAPLQQAWMKSTSPQAKFLPQAKVGMVTGKQAGHMTYAKASKPKTLKEEFANRTQIKQFAKALMKQQHATKPNCPKQKSALR